MRARTHTLTCMWHMAAYNCMSRGPACSWTAEKEELSSDPRFQAVDKSQREGLFRWACSPGLHSSPLCMHMHMHVHMHMRGLRNHALHTQTAHARLT